MAAQQRKKADVSSKTRLNQDVSYKTGHIGLFVFLSCCILMRGMFDFTILTTSIVSFSLTLLTMVLWDFLKEDVYKKSGLFLDEKERRTLRECRKRIRTKIVALWTTWATLAAGLWAFPYFHTENFVFSSLVYQLLVPTAIPLSLIYIAFVDKRLKDPEDDLYHAGLFLTGRWSKMQSKRVKNHALGWLVKGFFLTFMLSIIPPIFKQALSGNILQFFTDPAQFFIWLIACMFLIDIVFATIGYVVSFKVLNSHIRTAEPTIFGWLVALVCYPPFSIGIFGELLDYKSSGPDWRVWLADYPTTLVAWGAILVVLCGIYAWSTAVFGLRFSNLTNRGVVTHGPYSFTRHPAYISKNLFWWLSAMPFLYVAESSDAIRACMALGFINLIYFLRAKTEEKHMLKDPKYQAYYAWIEENGLFAPLNRWWEKMNEFDGEGSANNNPDKGTDPITQKTSIMKSDVGQKTN